MRRHVIINRFNIDIYVRTTNTYVEYDGVYYHGLDRPYDQLSPGIRKKYDRDRIVDAWFRERGIRLVRITCRDWLAMTDDQRSEWIRGEILTPQLSLFE